MPLSPTIARLIVAPEQPVPHRERAFHVRPAAGAGCVQQAVAAARAGGRQLGKLVLQFGGVEDFAGERAAGHGVASGAAVADPSTLPDREV